MQGRSRDTDAENKRMDTKGGKLRWVGHGGVLNWAIGLDMYTLMCIKLMTNKNLLYKKNKIKFKNKKKILSTVLLLRYLYDKYVSCCFQL